MQKKTVSIVLFLTLYIMPFYISYKSKGIVFSGNVNYKNSLNLIELNEIFNFSIEYLYQSLNLFNNQIFVFFLSAILFKYIVGLFK